MLVPKSKKSIFQLKMFDINSKSWIDKCMLEIELPDKPFAEGIIFYLLLLNPFVTQNFMEF